MKLVQLPVKKAIVLEPRDEVRLYDGQQVITPGQDSVGPYMLKVEMCRHEPTKVNLAHFASYWNETIAQAGGCS